ncbi:MAG: gamma-glutamyl-gamma-aminobutyrate hydrolase family protein [Deltaproteobacteria bacterium]|nr:gamma-glutamyl-gamma-aminobutyrate hydrolase family protein [Deltaproteobacteria bacterium]
MRIVLAIDPAQPHAAYRDALLSAGALPEEVEIVQPGDALPEEFDGLVLSGGSDVDPSRYGEVPLNGSVDVDTGRDELDFELLARAERLAAPVFGICRGLQVVNVALGGMLWQDLPSQRPRGVEHSFPRRNGHSPAHLAHEIRIARTAPRALPLVAALSATDGLLVNSRHHQAVKDLAPGLVALAASPDDHVEAFARGSAPFLSAVQWHPENLVDRTDQKALFVEFLAAARLYAARDDHHDPTPLGTRIDGETSSPAERGPDKEPEPS